MRASATVYAPDRTTSGSAGTTYSAHGGTTPNAPLAPMQVAECDVLHLILGPVHLDLLGLVVDINKVVLDLKGIPGTLLGDIFCQLSSTPPAPPTAGPSKVAGTVSTQMVINRFTAVGKRVVGQGTVVSTYTDTAGATSVKRRSFRVTIPKQAPQQLRWSAVQQEPLCQILFLEIGEVDLTLAGLHVIARAFNPDEPIRLRLQARRSGGILGRLFCDLAEGGGVASSKRKARGSAQALTTRMRGSTIMRMKAVIYAPRQTTSGAIGTMSSAAPNTPQAPTQVAECNVLHLILGPVHLDLLGLIADLNKIMVDIKAVPGTLLGDIFCLLSSDPDATTTAAGTGAWHVPRELPIESRGSIMKSAIIAGVVAMLVSSASATAAFVVTSKNIKNGTIQTVDLSAKAKKALKGNVGPAGARGPAGPQGPAGFVGATRVVSATFAVPSNTAGSPQTVSCPAGTGVISGGVISDTQGDTWVDAPSGNGWSGAANNVAGINPGGVTVYALCAQGVAAPASVSAGLPSD